MYIVQRFAVQDRIFMQVKKHTEVQNEKGT